MDQKSEFEFETSVVRYLDGALDRQELRAFNEALASDAMLRELLRETAEQAVAMGDLGRSRTGSSLEQATSLVRPRFGGRLAVRVAWAAAAAAVVGVGFWSWFPREQVGPVVAKVGFADGALLWTGSGEGEGMALSGGEMLPAGIVQVESASGSAQLVFEDGTQVTVGGESELVVSAGEGKRFRLRKGEMTADVSPQPEGSPLLVSTATAEIEVLGTVFSAVATERETVLSVESGLVRFRRIADGEVIDVPAGHAAVASLETGHLFAAHQIGELSASWTLGLDRPMREVTKGERATVAGEPCLGAVSYVAGRDEDGNPMMRRGISVNGDPTHKRAFVRMTEGTEIRVRYRSDWGPEVFLGTVGPDGRFGGNFIYRIPHEHGDVGDSSWKEAVIPLSAFRLADRIPSRTGTYDLVHNEVRKILISTESHKRLQVSSIAVEAPESTERGGGQ